MRPNRILIAAALACVPALASAAPGTTTAPTAMRQGPGPESRVVLSVPRGAVLDVVGCADWCKVDYRGVTGWIARESVATGRGRPATLPPAPGSRPAPALAAGTGAIGWFLTRDGIEFRVYSDRTGRPYYEHLGRRHHLDRRDVSRERAERRDRWERGFGRRDH